MQNVWKECQPKIGYREICMGLSMWHCQNRTMIKYLMGKDCLTL